MTQTKVSQFLNAIFGLASVISLIISLYNQNDSRITIYILVFVFLTVLTGAILSYLHISKQSKDIKNTHYNLGITINKYKEIKEQLEYEKRKNRLDINDGELSKLIKLVTKGCSILFQAMRDEKPYESIEGELENILSNIADNIKIIAQNIIGNECNVALLIIKNPEKYDKTSQPSLDQKVLFLRADKQTFTSRDHFKENEEFHVKDVSVLKEILEEKNYKGAFISDIESLLANDGKFKNLYNKNYLNDYKSVLVYPIVSHPERSKLCIEGFLWLDTPCYPCFNEDIKGSLSILKQIVFPIIKLVNLSISNNDRYNK